MELLLLLPLELPLLRVPKTTPTTTAVTVHATATPTKAHARRLLVASRATKPGAGFLAAAAAALEDVSMSILPASSSLGAMQEG